MSRSAEYRPLNVRDALSYLDQVKVQFSDKPDVYNRFLDVMKEFKSQVIDTPGVIDRVSNLFKGHPTLIQGFNTFLPPGYRIECMQNRDGQDMITVTTPSGTISQVAGTFAASQHKLKAERDNKQSSSRPREKKSPSSRPTTAAPGPAGSGSSSAPQQPGHSHLSSGPPPFQGGATAQRPSDLPQSAPCAAGRPQPQTAQPATSLSIPPQQPVTASGPSTPSAVQVLANGTNVASGVSAPEPPGVHFNHAITFVNTIKQRYHRDQDVYKRFLEILQTYQRDGQAIAEVYEQVEKLFVSAPDLLEEFKRFLPEHGGGGLFGSVVQHATAQAQQDKGSKRGGAAKDQPKKKRGAAAADGKPSKRSKNANKADSPAAEDDVSILTNIPQTLASPEDVAFFDKVKKLIDDKTTYHEFLKLINLWVQDFIDLKSLVERAQIFIGHSSDVWALFKRIVHADELGQVGPAPNTSQGGYGFGGMINIDNAVAENTPMLDRVKPDLSGSKVKSYGPSYRKLPKSEINLQCTGRDAMCWEVLNDEWVSHPIWAAEDAAPFMTHKKNAYEEALHKSEEERHEYDYHIEANLRTIALLEPLNNKIQTMDPEERAHFNLKTGLGSQSKSIYQRMIKKVYGKEVGPEVIKALHDNPVATLPIVLERLKSKDEEWKKAQRDWNRAWREQDAKNFYKALDHQGVQFKTNDKKTIGWKNLIAEADLRKREQLNTRDALIDQSSWRSRPQFEFDFSDMDVLKDAIKLVLSYLDRVTTALSPSDRNRIERHLRDFIPYLMMLDKEDFDAEFADIDENGDDSVEDDSVDDASMADDDETASTAAARKSKKGPAAADLRMKLLKQVGEKEGRDKRGSTMTPGPDDGNGDAQDRTSVEGTPATENGDRAETPLPIPADPAAVAEAVEKDRAGAEASEQTWAHIESPAASQVGSAATSEVAEGSSRKPSRKANFFANSNYYVLLRLIQILYSRLVTCKQIAQKLASEKTRPINPIAIRLGLAEPDTQFFGIEEGKNPAEHYYVHLLMSAEKLFEGEIDANTFEEIMRVMFGNQAYIMFTLDRVVAAIVKQTQTNLGDLKSQELFALLVRDRANEATTTRQQIAYRSQAEVVLGPEENLYRMEYISSRSIVAVQLLGKEDLTIDDAVTVEEKWRQYIDSYALTHPTEGLPHRVDPPFLKRNIETISDEAQNDQFRSEEGLALKIAVGNYRMFFLPDTEDSFSRIRTRDEYTDLDAKEQKYLEAAKKRMEDKYRNAPEAASAASVPT